MRDPRPSPETLSSRGRPRPEPCPRRDEVHPGRGRGRPFLGKPPPGGVTIIPGWAEVIPRWAEAALVGQKPPLIGQRPSLAGQRPSLIGQSRPRRDDLHPWEGRSAPRRETLLSRPKKQNPGRKVPGSPSFNLADQATTSRETNLLQPSMDSCKPTEQQTDLLPSNIRPSRKKRPATTPSQPRAKNRPGRPQRSSAGGSNLLK